MKIKKIAALALTIFQASAFPFSHFSVEGGTDYTIETESKDNENTRGIIRPRIFASLYETQDVVAFFNMFGVATFDNMLQQDKENNKFTRTGFELNPGVGIRYKISSEHMAGVSIFGDLIESYFKRVEQASEFVLLLMCFISIFLFLLSIIDRIIILPILPIPFIPTFIFIIFL